MRTPRENGHFPWGWLLFFLVITMHTEGGQFKHAFWEMREGNWKLPEAPPTIAGAPRLVPAGFLTHLIFPFRQIF